MAVGGSGHNALTTIYQSRGKTQHERGVAHATASVAVNRVSRDDTVLYLTYAEHEGTDLPVQVTRYEVRRGESGGSGAPRRGIKL